MKNVDSSRVLKWCRLCLFVGLFVRVLNWCRLCLFVGLFVNGRFEDGGNVAAGLKELQKLLYIIAM